MNKKHLSLFIIVILILCAVAFFLYNKNNVSSQSGGDKTKGTKDTKDTKDTNVDVDLSFITPDLISKNLGIKLSEVNKDIIKNIQILLEKSLSDLDIDSSEQSKLNKLIISLYEAEAAKEAAELAKKEEAAALAAAAAAAAEEEKRRKAAAAEAAEKESREAEEAAEKHVEMQKK